MVRLSLSAFADASSQLYRNDGIQRTRLTVKLRPRSGTVVLRATDDHTTLTTEAHYQGELKLVEKIVAQYMMECTTHAAAAAAPVEVDAGKKGKGKGKKK